MQGTSKSPATNERISFSSDSVGDGFVGFLKYNGVQEQRMLDAVDFVSSPSFVEAFGAAKIVNLALELLSMYPKSAKTTQALLKSLCGTPTIARIADLLEKLPDNFFESLPDGLRETVALAFRDSLNQEVAAAAIRFCKSPEAVIGVSLPSSTVCLADIFNENVQEILDNQNRLQSFIEQLGPLSAKDIADFIANLADEHNEVIKAALANHDKSSLLPLLRVLKTPRISVDDIISSFDKERLEVTSQASIQFLLSAVKEVSGAKTVPMLPFLGKWKNPKTQIQLISLIVSFGQTLVSFPKPEQIARANSVIIGDFKSDLWRSSDFLMSLAYLYDFLPDSVDALLQEYSGKGPALLLLVLAQTGSACPFASHLARLLFLKQSQYMAGFSALWATNPKFLVDVILSLYNQRPQMLGRFCDLVDDLCVFDEFLELSPLLFKVLLHVSAFFRRGNDLEKGLKGLYEKDKTVLDYCFNVFENPLQYGLSAPMKTERRVGGNEQTFSADMLFFRFLDQIYAKLDDSCKKRVVTMFSKCSTRTPTLAKCTFSWSSAKLPQLPKASMPVSESDYLKLAVATKPDDIKRFQLTVASLLTNIPREKTKAEGNGKALGRLLAGDLLSQVDSTKALQLIDNGLNQKENSPGFAFAIAALKEMKESFEIYIPFTNYIIGNAKLRKHAPDIHQAAVTACEPKSVMRPLRDNMEIALPLAHYLERFRDIELREESLNFDQLNTDVTQWDKYALLYMKNEISRLVHFQSQPNPKFIATCVEACLYLVHKLITSPDARRVATRIALTRLGQWLGQHTLRMNRPVFARLLDISQLLLYSYSHSVLSSAIPFVYMFSKEASDIFTGGC